MPCGCGNWGEKAETRVSADGSRDDTAGMIARQDHIPETRMDVVKTTLDPSSSAEAGILDPIYCHHTCIRAGDCSLTHRRRSGGSCLLGYRALARSSSAAGDERSFERNVGKLSEAEKNGVVDPLVSARCTAKTDVQFLNHAWWRRVIAKTPQLLT
jgi:hypothetical protein